MKDFATFWTKLTENSLWFEQITVKYCRKNIKEVGEKFFIDLLARPDEFRSQNFELWRRQFQKWLMWEKDVEVKPQLQQQGETFKESENFLTGEAREKRIKEVLAIIKNAPMSQPPPRISKQQLAEEGGWVPKKDAPIIITEEQKQKALLDHMETVRTAKRKEFLHYNPDATEEQIKEYIDGIEFDF